MSIGLIWAQNEQGIIGIDNEIPWHVPEDFKHFKETTIDSTIVMGRKTWESLPKTPLPYRENIVLSKKNNYFKGALHVSSINEILELAQHKTLWVIGGSTVYKEFIPYAEKLVVTFIKYEIPGSILGERALAPSIDFNKWEKTKTIKEDSLSKTGINYEIIEFSLI